MCRVLKEIHGLMMCPVDRFEDFIKVSRPFKRSPSRDDGG